jgi:diacylglycerol kinase (ATP)
MSDALRSSPSSTPFPTAQRALIIANPLAGQQSAERVVREHVRPALQRYGINADIAVTMAEEAGIIQAQAAVAAGVQMIIAVGGDGTVEAIAQSILGTPLALGIVPLGTQNNLAQSLHIPLDLDRACAVIGRGEQRQIDIGMINGHPFLEMVSVGLESPLLTLGEASRHQGCFQVIGAMLAAWQIVQRAPFHRVTIDLDGKEHQVRTRQITICNTPRYGPGLLVAPDATLDDGMLDVVVTRHLHRRELLHYYWHVLRGHPVAQRRVEYHRAQHIHIGSHHALPVVADGVLQGTTPISVHLIPQHLTVMVPSERQN